MLPSAGGVKVQNTSTPAILSETEFFLKSPDRQTSLSICNPEQARKYYDLISVYGSDTTHKKQETLLCYYAFHNGVRDQKVKTIHLVNLVIVISLSDEIKFS